MKKNISLRIENFRSLKDITLELTDVNLFIGPNNSGKTNVFRALQFLGNWLSTGQLGSFQDNYFGKDLNNAVPFAEGNQYLPISFTVQIENHKTEYYIYKVEFFIDVHTNNTVSINQLVGMTDFNTVKKNFIKNFDLKIADVQSYQSWFYQYEVFFQNPMINARYLKGLDANFIDDNDQIKRCFGAKLGVYLKASWQIHQTYAFLAQSSLANALNFHEVYKDILAKQNGFYAIRIDTIKAAAEYQKSPTVEYDGSNLLSFIDDMDNNSPEVLEQIKQDFRECIGNEFTNFKCPVFSNQDGKVKRKLKFFDIQGNSYWADDVSEGVLYFLAIACILRQPNPSKFLLLEEIENGIHPRRISNIIDYIFDLAEQKDITVMITSHSPVVLNEFKDVLKNVFIFDKNEQNKASEVVKLSHFIENFNKNAKKNEFPLFPTDSSLGDYWLTGLINGIPK